MTVKPIAIVVTAVLLEVIIILMTPAQPIYAFSYGDLINLSNNTGFSTNPQITTFGSNVYVVWHDNTSGNDDIYFSASADNGTTFNGIENLSNNDGRSDKPQIAAVGVNVYVVWRDNSSGKDQIYFKRSSDTGNSFNTTENLSNTNGSSIHPQITATENNVYIVWSDNTTGNGDIYFKSSTDNGTSFSFPKNLSTNLDGQALFPQVESTGNNVYVVWEDETPDKGRIRFRASNDNGNDFSITRVLSQENEVNANSPRIDAFGNNVYVVWEDNSRSGNDTSENFDILYRASTDAGTNFTFTKIISKNPGDSYDPEIAAAGNNMYVVWEDNTSGNDTSIDWDIRFRASTDRGDTITNDTKVLSDGIGVVADFHQIATAEDNVYVVWSDIYTRSGYPSMYEVFFLASTDKGINFSNPVNISTRPGRSILPQIGASGDSVYVVWRDDTTGNGDIYFKKITSILP